LNIQRSQVRVHGGWNPLFESEKERPSARSLLAACILLFVLCTSACAPPPELPVPDFGPGDTIRCTTGGGEGAADELLLTGEGILTYKPIKGPVKRGTLTPEKTQALYQELVQAGLLDIRDVPNREMERFGVLLEVKLGERTIRGTIGILEMDRAKHHSWRVILGILTKEIEASCEENT
jgi:hypothetical protein